MLSRPAPSRRRGRAPPPHAQQAKCGKGRAVLGLALAHRSWQCCRCLYRQWPPGWTLQPLLLPPRHCLRLLWLPLQPPRRLRLRRLLPPRHLRLLLRLRPPRRLPLLRLRPPRHPRLLCLRPPRRLWPGPLCLPPSRRAAGAAASLCASASNAPAGFGRPGRPSAEQDCLLACSCPRLARH